MKSCSLSVFYIKPQPSHSAPAWRYVVPYQYSTSKRNMRNMFQTLDRLFLISILHQTATLQYIQCFRRSCSLSVFYIKPQRLLHALVR